MTASITRRRSRRTGMKSKAAVAGAIAVTGALLLTGCGDQRDKTTTTTSTGDTNKAPLFNTLPAEIQSAGVIKVGSDIAYPPVEFKKNGQVVGLDPDLAAALGKV
ncbi:ABC transporter substrate-binding protein, partial [Streptomyces sp. MCAF7]